MFTCRHFASIFTSINVCPFSLSPRNSSRISFKTACRLFLLQLTSHAFPKDPAPRSSTFSYSPAILTSRVADDAREAILERKREVTPGLFLLGKTFKCLLLLYFLLVANSTIHSVFATSFCVCSLSDYKQVLHMFCLSVSICAHRQIGSWEFPHTRTAPQAYVILTHFVSLDLVGPLAKTV